VTFWISKLRKKKKMKIRSFVSNPTNPKSAIRNPKFVVFFCAILFAICSSVWAQQRAKIPLIGVLEPTSEGTCNNGFRQGLRDLGYVERQNILLEERYAKSKPDRLHELAGELAQLKPDIIWTHSPPSVLAAKRATRTIPIVVGVARDLVELGIVSSFARPGGNVNGMELRDSEIIGKRLELLKQVLPKASRVAVLVNPNDPGHAVIPGNIEPEARALRVQLQRVEAIGSEAIDKAFAAMAQNRTDALLLPESAMLSANRHRIFELAISKRLPTAAGGPHFAEAGSLSSYGANVSDICRRSAFFIDKILKGRKPADLPVERPTKFELVINLKTAKQIGLIIPPHVLARADKVIR
jgi:putative tryptophan/tyrosine transport system substrate-binding protein